MNHREYFDQIAAEGDELLEEETIARLREIVSGLEIRPGGGGAGCGRLVICHANSRQAVNEIHRAIGGVVANDTIPPEGEMRRLFCEAGLDESVMRDEPDRYLALACRNGRG